MSAGLVVRDLVVAAGGARIVDGVSLRVAQGETLVVLGESGSGKTMTARAILGLLGPRLTVTGEVTLDGGPLVRGRDVGLVPQDHSAALDPLRRVGSQIAEVLRRHGVAVSRPRARETALELLDRVGVRDPARVARAYPHELSGGLRQRALIAVAIACGPRLLIADEPTSALDVTVQATVLGLLDGLGAALLMITHDIRVARGIGDAVAVMRDGRIVDRGPVRDVLDHPGHPYTRGLLDAEPRPGVPRGELAGGLA
ncbi:ABC transporter ATP-binding protein [Streptosporangium sp. CA-135522]|uniref:ABC transporter ATP-binding protein n=1 Tax=Streptosporangium sp. CA-135522 TaxID=3240072 RepID=UPI003D8A8DFD